MNLFSAALILALLSQAIQAGELSAEELLKLREAGSIESLAKLRGRTLALHPGGKLGEPLLEEAWGRYVYRVAVEDARGRTWAVTLDATNGQVLRDQQED